MASQIELVTIDNFSDKFSKYDDAHKQLFAIIDMGSNGIRFSISDLSAPRSRLLPCLYTERASISLYDALHDHKDTAVPEQLIFSSKVIVKVAKTLARFKNICHQYGVPAHQIDVFATAAMRSAENRTEMLAEIKRKSGLEVKILEPSTESLFGAMGARSGFDGVDGLFMDLGGGSCQMTYVDSNQAEYGNLAASAGRSIPFGAARLTNEFRRAKTQAESSSIQHELERDMKAMYEALKRQSPDIKRKLENEDGVHLYMCGGGFRGYGSMLMYKHEIQPYPIPSIGGFTVSGKHFTNHEQMLHANNSEEKIFGLSKRRREQFPAITKVIEAVIAVVPRIKAVTFCTGSNREGALFMKLSPEIRESNPLDLFPQGLAIPQYSMDFLSSSTNSEALDGIVTCLSSALPKPSPISSSPIYGSSFIKYLSKNIWTDMGSSDEINSSKALHLPITGILDGLPGLTHELRAIIALTLCARWGTVLTPSNRILYDNLQLLIGKDLAFSCQYIGTVARFFSLFSAVLPKDGEILDHKVTVVHASFANDLGKKGHKSGIRTRFHINAAAIEHMDMENEMGMFKHVGKGLGKKVDISYVLEG